MPNPNYLAGRRFEYETMKYYRGMNYKVIRASGSHGEFDLVVWRGTQKPEFIQCKVVKTDADAEREEDKFRENRQPHAYFHQTIRIKVKGGEWKGHIEGDTI